MKFTKTGTNQFGGIWTVTEQRTMLGNVVSWDGGVYAVDPAGRRVALEPTRFKAAATLMGWRAA